MGQTATISGMTSLLIANIARLTLLFERFLIKLLRRILFSKFNIDIHGNQVHHIVVYRVGNLGDTIIALPALKAIRHTFPDSTITLVTSSGNSE